ncbi:MAG: shikimate kinase [Bacteroidetes bacterium]|nr:MAG: shikimate kinase [Bacteroidota bacterium]RLE00217.1 MAG: shikimate kinase [Bacteroidota bacterium]
MHTRIFLIGFMGSGKSTLGAQLARIMGYQFVDMDHLIEETAEMSIPEIFSEHGEEVFRKWEHDILLEVCRREKLVISTGGGAPCHSKIMDLMNANGTTIYLKLTPEALRDRLIQSKTERPLIKGKSESELLEFITGLLEQREKFYEQATHSVNGISLRSEELAKLLLNS